MCVYIHLSATRVTQASQLTDSFTYNLLITLRTFALKTSFPMVMRPTVTSPPPSVAPPTAHSPPPPSSPLRAIPRDLGPFFFCLAASLLGECDSKRAASSFSPTSGSFKVCEPVAGALYIYICIYTSVYISARFSQCVIGLTKPRTSEEEECVRDVTGVPSAAPPRRGRGCVQAGRSLPTEV
jgi:hypothetical protein